MPLTPNAVLLVCLGNICRSPSAEVVLSDAAKSARLAIHFDSAGTANYHIGKAPDQRAINIGKSLGYDLSHLKARQVKLADFYEFSLILAMDHSNLNDLQALHAQAIKQANGRAVADLQLFDRNEAVADPYYGDDEDFRLMFSHLQRVAADWIAEWR